MTLQREPGKSHEPMRPRLITLDLASGFNAPLDTNVPIDWSAGGGVGKLTLRQLNKYFDIPSAMVVDGNGDVQVGRGLWKARLVIEISNNGASAREFAAAITNADGSVVHAETKDIVFVPQIGRLTLELETLVKVTTATGVIAFRVARRTGGSTTTVQASYVGSVQKVANHGEAREV